MTRRVLVTGVVMGGAALSLWAARGGAAAMTGTGPDGAVCLQQPGTTAGPFPADGSNTRAGQTVNILTEAGVIRDDIRPSIGGLTPVAEGVPLRLEVTLVDVARSCAPLAGHAVYLWQCDAEAVYSIYGAADRNYLRGVAISDAEGRVRLTTVFPGCYPGRWPHLHFEVFASADAAVGGGRALLTGQFALPEAECRAVYAGVPLYAASRTALGGVSLTGDGVFRRSTDAELSAQRLVLTGSPDRGYAATGQVGLVL
jgi:protocatechuate 3,4-dioxygenase beta subunit